MAPKRKLTPEAQVAELHQRALRIQQKAGLNGLIQTLKDHPSLIPPAQTLVAQLLAQEFGQAPVEARGASLTGGQQDTEGQAGAGVASGAVSESAGGSEASQRSAGGAAMSLPDIPSGLDMHNLHEWVPHCYTTLAKQEGGMSVFYLKRVCAAIEPVAWSPLCVKGCVQKNRREVAKTSLAELLEFATGVGPDTPLTGRMRHLPSLVLQLQKLNEARGRRCRDLPLPICWQERGAYQVQAGANGQLLLHSRYGGWTTPLPKQWQAAKLEQVSLRLNFSEERAEVQVDGSIESLKCLSLRPDGGGERPEGRPNLGDWHGEPPSKRAATNRALATESRGAT
jgi:hypothetical protein